MGLYLQMYGRQYRNREDLKFCVFLSFLNSANQRQKRAKLGTDETRFDVQTKPETRFDVRTKEALASLLLGKDKD